MKATIKQLTGMVVLTTLLIFSGCNKKTVNPTVKPDKVTEDNSKLLHCSPWEDVADPNRAVTDLNAVAICNATACQGEHYDYHFNNITVGDSLGGIAYYDPYSTVTIADQNYIWSYAVNWAIAHTPAGYSLSQITFSTQTVTLTSGMFSIDMNIFKFNVNYKQCIGGGGGDS